MDYSTFTNDSLTMMYEAVRGALAADDAAKSRGEEPALQSQGYSDLDGTCRRARSQEIKRKMVFEIIAWDRSIDRTV